MAAESDDANWESMKIARINASAPIRVTSTISRYSLGTPYYKMFDPAKDDKNDPYYDWESDEGDYVIRHQIAWYIIKVCSARLPSSYRISSSLIPLYRAMMYRQSTR